jgi:phosphate starvation-inducible protein PhoH
MARKKPHNAKPLEKDNLKVSDVQPFNDRQADILHTLQATDKHISLLGYAGVGKSYLALAGASLLLERGDYNKIVIIRSAVQTRDIGHLPGSLEEKGLVYELPYRKIFSDIFKRDDAYDILKKKDIVRFMLTSYVRGLTMDNAIIVVEEAQNFTAHELASVITRAGQNSRIIITGDILQRDLTREKEKDVEKVFKVLEELPQFARFDFEADDIVRSGLVKDFIIKSTEMYPEGL